MSKKTLHSRTFQSILKFLHITSVASMMGGFLIILILLLERNMNAFTGTEIIHDKIMLTIFNTAVMYGGFVMVLTSTMYGFFTNWGFFEYYYLIVSLQRC